LEKLEILLKANKKDWSCELSSEERQEIEIGLKQADNNELICHQKVMNKFEKWH